jgi:hypothetical protein
MALWTKAGERGMVLLKLGSKDHLEELRHGLLYMNALSCFRLREDDSARSDKREGDDYILQPESASLVIDTGIPGVGRISAARGDLAGPVRIARNRTRSCNLFCMFAITEPVEHPVFGADHPWPGDSFVLFTHTQEFVSRIQSQAQQERLRMECGLVEYYDESTHSGQLGRFRKRASFSYQSEFRIALEPGSAEAIRLQVGDLADITSEVFPRDRADDVLKFGAKDLEADGICWD